MVSDTAYGGAESFEDRNEENSRQILEKYVPHLKACGFDHIMLRMDSQPLVVPAGWLFDNDVRKTRTPDILLKMWAARILGAPGVTDVSAEIKDYPRLSEWPRAIT